MFAAFLLEDKTPIKWAALLLWLPLLKQPVWLTTMGYGVILIGQWLVGDDHHPRSEVGAGGVMTWAALDQRMIPGGTPGNPAITNYHDWGRFKHSTHKTGDGLEVVWDLVTKWDDLQVLRQRLQRLWGWRHLWTGDKSLVQPPIEAEGRGSQKGGHGQDCPGQRMGGGGWAGEIVGYIGLYWGDELLHCDLIGLKTPLLLSGK